LTALGRASAYLGEDYLPSATYEAAASFMVGPAFPIPELADGVTPREALGSLVADLFQALLQVDLSDVSLPELLDTPQYFMFPNWIIFGTPAFPAMYRFLPNGDDPHSSIFEVRILMPTPAGQKPPPAAPLRVLGPDEPFTAVPELPAAYANIFDQDFSNFPFIQRGMRASANSGLKLAEYDESRIRHFHHLLEQWLSL
jgi:hypothetical protein